METSSLTALAEDHLRTARGENSGRSSTTLFGGHEHVLRQTLIALTAGHRLDEHQNPGDEITVQVLVGRVRVTVGDQGFEGGAGDLLVAPDARHGLEALEDSAVLLTVAKRP